jgi:hypothetical protein
MNAFAQRLNRAGRLPTLALALSVFAASAAQAIPIHYSVTFSGAAESPPSASPGTGYGDVDVDTGTHQMHLFIVFSGLIGQVSAAHIHAPTLVAGTGTAGVATMTPTFLGFPGGVSAGLYEMTFDMSQASSFNPTYIANNGGTPLSAAAALYQAMADGKAYFNIHTNAFPGGEIRGFLTPTAVSEETTSFGQVKTLFR